MYIYIYMHNTYIYIYIYIYPPPTFSAEEAAQPAGLRGQEGTGVQGSRITLLP